MKTEVRIKIDSDCGKKCDFYEEGLSQTDFPPVCLLFNLELYHGKRCDKCYQAEWGHITFP